MERSLLYGEAPYLTCELEVVSPPVALIRVTGELDAGTVAKLERAVASAEAVPGVTRIEIDSTGLRFVDLRGLAALLKLDQRLRAAGGRLDVLYPSSQLRRLLALTECTHLAGGPLTPEPV